MTVWVMMRATNCYVAVRFAECLRPSDMLVRLCEEFAILCEGVQDERVATEIADLFVQRALPTFPDRRTRRFYLGQSGVALASEPGRTAGDLLREADVALYE